MAEKEEKKLRHGYTTGACATAATKAALLALITQEKQSEVLITLPMGEVISFQLQSCHFTSETAEVGVMKDGGDDPDATHRAFIYSTVTWQEEPDIVIDGGIGVGRVTKPGLPIPVGEAAINPVPRKMIREIAESVLDQYGLDKGVRIIIDVPGGEEIAKKTLNGRLGIVGGISILGTRGIVVPFSLSAYKASIVRAISVAIHCGCDHLVLSTGGRSEKYGMSLYPELPEEAFIEMGDFVGFSLLQCKKQQVKRVTLIGMIGKFSKFAQGVMMVHAHSSSVDFTFLERVALEVGVPEKLRQKILAANTAAQVGNLLMQHGYPDFFEQLCRYGCQQGLKHVNGGMEIETIITTLNGKLLGRVKIDGAAREGDWN